MYWGQDVWGTLPWGGGAVQLRYPLRPPPPTLDDVLRGSATRLAKLTLTRNGYDVMELPAETWQVAVSRTGDQRRTLTATLPAVPELIPTGVQSVLHPAAWHEIRAEMGVYEPRYGTHWATVGVFPVSQTSVSVDPSGARISLVCEDRASILRSAAPLEPMVWEAGPPEDILAQALQHLTPWMTPRLYRTGLSLPEAVGGMPGCDWWKLCRDDIAAAAGADLFINAAGDVELRKIQDIATASPSWFWQLEDADAISRLDRSIDGRVMPDGVIVPWGKGKIAVYQPPAHTPGSVLRWWKYPGDASLITTEAHALWVGSREWLKLGRGVEKVTIEVPADYRVEAGDVAQLSALKYGVRQITAVESFTLTAGAATMNVEFAEWQVPNG